MRLILAALLGLLLSSSAGAFTWNECSFVIEDDPGNVGNKTPDGYKIHLFKDGNLVRTVDVGKNLTSVCVDVLKQTDVGDHTAYATAYNTAGESDPSITIPFVIDPLPSVPNAPSLKLELVTGHN